MPTAKNDSKEVPVTQLDTNNQSILARRKDSLKKAINNQNRPDFEVQLHQLYELHSQNSLFRNYFFQNGRLFYMELFNEAFSLHLHYQSLLQTKRVVGQSAMYAPPLEYLYKTSKEFAILTLNLMITNMQMVLHRLLSSNPGFLEQFKQVFKVSQAHSNPMDTLFDSANNLSPTDERRAEALAAYVWLATTLGECGWDAARGAKIVARDKGPIIDILTAHAEGFDRFQFLQESKRAQNSLYATQLTSLGALSSQPSQDRNTDCKISSLR